MATAPNKDIYNFINAIKNIGVKDDDAKKNIEKIREDLRASRLSCSKLIEEPYTEAFTAESENNTDD